MQGEAPILSLFEANVKQGEARIVSLYEGERDL